jgi:hypothetical protein
MSAGPSESLFKKPRPAPQRIRVVLFRCFACLLLSQGFAAITSPLGEFERRVPRRARAGGNQADAGGEQERGTAHYLHDQASSSIVRAKSSLIA